MNLHWKVSRNMTRHYAENKWADEITPLQVQIGKDVFDFDKDEHPRLSSLEKLGC